MQTYKHRKDHFLLDSVKHKRQKKKYKFKWLINYEKSLKLQA